jgi:HYDIN/CFA65/VesB-like, Ig-like domain
LIARVSALKHSPPFTELGGGSGITIGPGGSNNVTIMFSPKKKGLRTDQIVITSNDPKHKKPIKVKIKGKSK